MEKHKPYKCTACGKRYKNLNGLKYHKNHSPICDNEKDSRPVSPVRSIKAGSSSSGALPIAQDSIGIGMQGLNFGAFNGIAVGLPGIEEDMIM